MSAQHTPGPWFTRHPDGTVMSLESTGPNTARYRTVCRNASISDARLIAAAPELLEALEAVCAVRVGRDDNIWAGADKCRAIARAAIAKARGQA